MNRQPPHVAWFIISAIVFVILMAVGLGVLTFYFLDSGSELVLGSMIILGASVLTVLLFIMAAAFSSLNLTDRQQALGLPPGSIRALIALLLIIIWAIVSIFVIRLVAFPNIYKQAASADSIKLAQQLFTTMSTLVVAIAAFYFGSSSVRSARIALAPTSEQPVITNIIPNSGNQGQTDIHLTILGKNFGSPKSVRLVLNNEQINAGPPTYTQTDVSSIECNISIAAHQTLGKWDVIVVNYDGTEYKQDKAFEVTKPPSAPTVTDINPTSGSAAGGDTVTITGTGFIMGSTSVSFGGAAASNVTVVSDTQITATSPGGSGTVNVTVTTPDGNASVPFTYNPAPAGPTVSDINPSSGPAAGGTDVTITGTGFIMGSTSVSFGGTAASNVTVVSDTQITTTSPAGSGTVEVTVTTPNGTSATSIADQFTYT